MQTKYKSREDLKTNPLYNASYDNDINKQYKQHDVISKVIGKDKDGNLLMIGVTIDPNLQSDNHKFTESLRLMLNEIENKSTLKKDEDKKYLDEKYDNGYENGILTNNRFENGYTYFELFTRDKKTLEKKQLAIMSGNINKDEHGYQFTGLNAYVPEEHRGKKYSELLVLNASKILLENGVNRISGSMSQDSQNVHGGIWTNKIVENAGYNTNITNTKGYSKEEQYQVNTYGTKNLYPVAQISQENITELEQNLTSKGFDFKPQILYKSNVEKLNAEKNTQQKQMSI